MTKKMPSAIEGAYVVLLGQNALLFSKPIKSIVTGTTLSGVHIVICLIAIISFFNVAANWVSSLEIDHDPVDYKSSHLFWDIAILGILFSTTQTLIELCGESFTISLSNAIIITSVFYTLLCFIYIIWNRIEIRERNNRELKDSNNKIHVLETANITNTINIIISIFLLTLPFFSKDTTVLYGAFTLWTIVWFYVMIIFVNGNTLFQNKLPVTETIKSENTKG